MPNFLKVPKNISVEWKGKEPLTLPEGKHQIVIRNADFPPYSATISVAPGQAVNLKHKFGS